MIIDVKITGQLLEAKVAGLTDPVIAEKAKRKHFCRIEADGEWDGMAMRLIYRSVTAAGEIARESIVYNREAVSVPDEVLRAGRLYITAVGVADDGNVRLTTADMRIGLKIWPVALIKATAGKALSPSQYEELLVSDQVLLDLIDQVYSSVGDVSNLDTAAKENLVAAVNELQGLLSRCRRPVEVYGEAPVDGLHYEAVVEGLVVERGLEILLTVASTNQGDCDLSINGGDPYPLCYRPGYFVGENYLRPTLQLPLPAESLLRGGEYVFRFDGIAWVLMSHVAVSGSGGGRVFVQEAEPETAQEGDVWIDPNEETVTLVTRTEMQDYVAEAIADALTAMPNGEEMLFG